MKQLIFPFVAVGAAVLLTVVATRHIHSEGFQGILCIVDTIVMDIGRWILINGYLANGIDMRNLGHYKHRDDEHWIEKWIELTIKVDFQ